jgi:demethylmenaquinone methyltransferase/2-methoxy-6-polyprenyl-1,4-benzoquinol methylase
MSDDDTKTRAPQDRAGPAPEVKTGDEPPVKELAAELAAEAVAETVAETAADAAETGSSPAADDARVPFGYSDIPAFAKAKRVRAVFESVATRYDLMNDLMSGGIHRLWKNVMIDWLQPRPGQDLLDVAGGTGDIALRIAARRGRNAPGRLTVLDLTPEMLEVGRDRAIDRGFLAGSGARAMTVTEAPDRPAAGLREMETQGSGLHWVCGDAEALPLQDCSQDGYTIAFGLRNVTRIDRALAEAQRVLKPGGRFLCLEFSRVVLPVFDRLYDLYSFQALPALGARIAGDREAYLYLAESIRRFPPQEELCDLLRQAGFSHVRYRNLSGGIAALHSAWRI